MKLVLLFFHLQGYLQYVSGCGLFVGCRPFFILGIYFHGLFLLGQIHFIIFQQVYLRLQGRNIITKSFFLQLQTLIGKYDLIFLFQYIIVGLMELLFFNGFNGGLLTFFGGSQTIELMVQLLVGLNNLIDLFECLFILLFEIDLALIRTRIVI